MIPAGALRYLRISAGYTQGVLAQKIGCSTPTISRIEAGAPPSLEILNGYAAAFHYRLWDIIFFMAHYDAANRGNRPYKFSIDLHIMQALWRLADEAQHPSRRAI